MAYEYATKKDLASLEARIKEVSDSIEPTVKKALEPVESEIKKLADLVVSLGMRVASLEKAPKIVVEFGSADVAEIASAFGGLKSSIGSVMDSLAKKNLFARVESDPTKGLLTIQVVRVAEAKAEPQKEQPAEA